MLHSEQKCAYFCSEWSIVGYGTGAFWICELDQSMGFLTWDPYRSTCLRGSFHSDPAHGSHTSRYGRISVWLHWIAALQGESAGQIKTNKTNKIWIIQEFANRYNVVGYSQKTPYTRRREQGIALDTSNNTPWNWLLLNNLTALHITFIRRSVGCNNHKKTREA